jgi:hypothetical protein
MKSFAVASGSPAEFIDRVRRELAERGLDRFAELAGDDSMLVVRFRWMGTTELRYRLEPADGGFSAVLDRQSVSPFHAPFRQSFDERFDDVLARVGAKPLDDQPSGFGSAAT